MDATWRIELLGGLRAEGGGGRVVSRFRTQKIAALLGTLAFHRDRAHPREELTELLWPGAEPGDGRNSLRYALSSLRRQLEPPGIAAGSVIVADRASVRLHPATSTTDVAELRAALAGAARARGGERARELERAVGLYRGELLPGHYLDWVLRERDRLRDEVLAALHEIVGGLLDARDFERAVDRARRATGLDPLREESRRDLMRALAGAGRFADALREARDVERLLSRELGVAPARPTRELAREIERRAAAGSGPAAPAAPAARPDRAAKPDPAAPMEAGIAAFLAAEIDAARRAQLAAVCGERGGREVASPDETFRAVFARPGDALDAAVAARAALGAEPFAPAIALDTGEAGAGAEPFAPVARLLAAAQRGRILCSERTAVLLGRAARPPARLVDLGLYRLAGAPVPERLFDLRDAAAPAPPPPRAEPAPAARLPVQLTRFFGREEELARLRALLASDSSRLVTITGPGGTGKTRLAIEAALRGGEPFAGAIWFVPLADVATPRPIVEAIRDALCLPRSSGAEPLDQVARELSRERSLVLLDGFEHLLDEGAPLVRTLLERVPSLQLLVTSRRPLRIAGERELELPPLAVPERADAPERLLALASVALFVDRAQAARADFQVTPGNAEAVAEICRRLDGIPLALELAASRAPVLTPAQIAARLAQPFELLVSRDRGATERHRTLRATIEWSCRLLRPEALRFFARLSVFRGGFSLESAEAVSGESAVERLAELRESSLVFATEGPSDLRFRMLEVLREYAAELLSPEERAEIRRRHAEHYVAFAERGEAGLAGPDQRAWLERLETEHDNFRAALEWGAREPDPSAAETALALAGTLRRFWYIRGHWHEGRRSTAALLERSRARTAARARALATAGVLAFAQGDSRDARARHEEGLAIARERGDRRGIAEALNNVGRLDWSAGDHAAAHALFEESLAIRRELGDRKGVAMGLNNLGLVAQARGDRAAARRLFEESLALQRALGDRSGTAVLLNNLGNLATEMGEYDAARALLERCVALARELGDELHVARAGLNLGACRHFEGDHASARAALEAGLASFRRLGAERDVAFAQQRLGAALLALGDPAAARARFEQSLAGFREIADERGVGFVLRGLGDAARVEGDAAAARGHYEEAIERIRRTGERAPAAAACLEGLAALAFAGKDAKAAARLLGAAAALREEASIPLSPAERGACVALASAVRQAIGEAAFAGAFAAGRAAGWEHVLEPTPARRRRRALPRRK